MKKKQKSDKVEVNMLSYSLIIFGAVALGGVVYRFLGKEGIQAATASIGGYICNAANPCTPTTATIVGLGFVSMSLLLIVYKLGRRK